MSFAIQIQNVSRSVSFPCSRFPAPRYCEWKDRKRPLFPVSRAKGEGIEEVKCVTPFHCVVLMSRIDSSGHVGRAEGLPGGPGSIGSDRRQEAGKVSEGAAEEE